MTMDAETLDLATRFGTALETASRTGDWTAVYPCLAPDVEWVTPMRTLTGIDEVEHDLTWAWPRERLDREYQVGDWEDRGEGRAAIEVREIYRMRDSGDFAYQRDLRIEITIRAGKIARYEIRPVG
jgi:ketosteroid isomerase-like protein